jgi:hypothetical protein
MNKKTKNCLLLLLVVIVSLLVLRLVVSYFVNPKSITIEKFVDSTTAAAFSVPTLKKWSFEESSSWYKVLPKGSSYQVPFSDLGFTMPNSVISISFLINIVGGSAAWREVFRFNDGTSRDCCEKGDRIPAFFVWPDNTTKFHIRFSTDGDGNDGIDSPTLIPMATPVMITLVFDTNNFKLYINNNISYSGDFNNVFSRTDKTILYIGENFDSYGADGNILIKNFTVYDGALSETDVTNMYNKLEELPPGVAGPAGPAGPAGTPGVAGPAGAPGVSGQPGTPGIAGPAGTPGVAGKTGLTGPKGNTGPKGSMGEPPSSSSSGSNNNTAGNRDFNYYNPGTTASSSSANNTMSPANTTSTTSSSGYKNKFLKFEHLRV